MIQFCRKGIEKHWRSYSRFAKRLMDIALSISLLFLVSPLLVAILILVRIRLGSPAVFRQVRLGIHGCPFVMYKLRTMTDKRDRNGSLLSDEERLTGLGALLRRYSLDELPELVNVLKGEMSIVGPRPLLLQYLNRYTPEQARRHLVKPGITGWAQVNGRNAISWEEKFERDVWYVDNQSLRLDMKILIFTLIKVLNHEGISQSGEATMKEFKRI
ncbi:MAG: sugar transferase [Syntrophobacteraceae bacterium]